VSALRNRHERPAFGRRPSLLNAVVLVEGRTPLKCFVVDIGEGGAVLEFWKPLALRPHFRLQWESLGIGAECTVHHTEGSQVEVRFTSDEGPAIARRFGARVDAPVIETANSVLALPKTAEHTYKRSAGADLVRRLRATRGK
jgi:hypothetical protein